MKLTLSQIISFFCFSENSIKAIAANRSATWIGLLFVLAAGLAREYDGEYLVKEPWHAILPVAASLIGCLFMVVLVFLNSCWTKGEKVSFLDTFRCILNVYWMTAPLAFVYAIPVERAMDAGAATTANLLLLGVVAVWRVALMVRCVQVLYDVHWSRALMPVMLFSDILAMTAIALVPGPIFMIMGGVRLTESESTILTVRVWLTLLGYGSFFIWFFGYVGQGFSKTPWNFFSDRARYESYHGASRTLWVFVVLSLLIWIPILPATQNEQMLRWKSEQLIHEKDYEAFAKLTQNHQEDDFPPHWDPPPRIGYGENDPIIEAVLVKLSTADAADWMVEKYVDKIRARHPWSIFGVLDSLSVDELRELVMFIENHEDGKELAEIYLHINPRDLADTTGQKQKLISQLAARWREDSNTEPTDSTDDLE